VPASGVVGFPATVLRRGASADQKKTQTISLNCGATHSPGKIEYNCHYFNVTFRTQIHKKKFSQKCFRDLQGTMSHRPLTNTSSLKIAAAYSVHTLYGIASHLIRPSPFTSLLGCSVSVDFVFMKMLEK
jgi:hypothetical protein